MFFREVDEVIFHSNKKSLGEVCFSFFSCEISNLYQLFLTVFLSVYSRSVDKFYTKVCTLFRNFKELASSCVSSHFYPRILYVANNLGSLKCLRTSSWTFLIFFFVFPLTTESLHHTGPMLHGGMRCLAGVHRFF